MADYATEGGHFYKKDGTPCYTIKGKNGVERPTTLRDARKLNLVPSVTTIIACCAKPGLEAWKQEQTIMACLTLPKIEGESEADFIARLKADSKEQSEKAKERGTQIHAWVQMGFEGQDVPPEGQIFYDSARMTLDFICGDIDWISEKPFANERYGGKVDLHSLDYLIDIKSTDKDLATVKTWDEHAMQLAAYNMGIWDTFIGCGILYVNSKTAEAKLILIDAKEIERGYECFNALLDYWYAKNKLGR